MDTWDISSLEIQPHHPEVLRSDDETRVIAIHLPGGEALQEHQVQEQAGRTVVGGPGFLAHFEPAEPHEVRATRDARLVLLLSPWPGDGHPRRRG